MAPPKGQPLYRTYTLSAACEDILTLLENQELHAGQIVEAISEASDWERVTTIDSIHPTLRRMLQRGWVTCREEDKSERRKGGALLKYYRISKEGKELLTLSRTVRLNLQNWKPA